jgi:ubiquinone biosynthesis protein UbiJ
MVIPFAAALADPDPAPFINHQIKELTKQIADDLTSGKLTKNDADELTQAVEHVKNVEASEPSLTPRTRADLREDLSRITKDLERKEDQSKALSSPSPTP